MTPSRRSLLRGFLALPVAVKFAPAAVPAPAVVPRLTPELAALAARLERLYDAWEYERQRVVVTGKFCYSASLGSWAPHG